MLELVARTNQKLLVTNRQMEILVGCILGDAYISPRGQIQIMHSHKQLSYILWKYKELQSIAYGFPTKVDRYNKKYQKVYVAYRFWLRQYFRPYRYLFYPDGKKIFPTGIEKYFTSLSLAVWYMDDGNFSDNKNVKVAVDGFDWETREAIRNFLFRKFILKSTLHNNGKMRISNKSLPRFFEIVSPYIHSSMKYKIP